MPNNNDDDDPLRLSFSRQSRPSALAVAAASDGKIIAVHGGRADINWGRRRALSCKLNPDTTNAVNKRVMRELFAEHAVPSPHLMDADEAFVAMNNGEIVSGEVLGRPDFHTRGRGFYRCTTPDQVRAAEARGATHFMRWITDVEAPKEFRVHVFKGKSIRMSLKEHLDFHKYITRKPPEGFPKKPIRQAAIAAMEAVGLDFGVVDILASEDQTVAYVLEVNAAPGLGGTTPQLWADTFIDYFTEEVRNA